MSLIILPLLIVCTHVIVELLTKVKHPFVHYIRLFTICLGWNIFFDSYLHASESTNEYNERNMFFHECSIEINELRQNKFIQEMSLSPLQIKEFTGKMVFHEREGQRCFREAEKTCILIPNESDKNIALYLFGQALIISINSGNFPAVVITLEANLAAYGIYQYEQWYKMETLLHESRYHFEMSDFYKNVLKNG